MSTSERAKALPGLPCCISSGHGQVTTFSHRGVPQLPLTRIGRPSFFVPACGRLFGVQRGAQGCVIFVTPGSREEQSTRAPCAENSLGGKREAQEAHPLGIDSLGRRIAGECRDVVRTSRLGGLTMFVGYPWPRRASLAPSLPSAPSLEQCYPSSPFSLAELFWLRIHPILTQIKFPLPGCACRRLGASAC